MNLAQYTGDRTAMTDPFKAVLGPDMTRPILALVQKELAAHSLQVLEDASQLNGSNPAKGHQYICVDALTSALGLICLHMFRVSPPTFIQTESEFINTLAVWVTGFQSQERVEAFKDRVLECNCDMGSHEKLSILHIHNDAPSSPEERWQTFVNSLFALLHQLSTNVSVAKVLKTLPKFPDPQSRNFGTRMDKRMHRDGNYLLSEFLYGRHGARPVWLKAMLAWFEYTRSSAVILCLLAPLSRYSDRESRPTIALALREFPHFPKLLVDEVLEKLRLSKAGFITGEGGLKDMLRLATMAKSIVLDFDGEGFGRQDAGYIFQTVYKAVLSERNEPSSPHPTIPSPLPWLAAIAVHLYPAIEDMPDLEEMLQVLQEELEHLASWEGPCSRLEECLELMVHRGRTCQNLHCPKHILGAAKFLCSKCRIYKYCSKHCQAQAWGDEERPHRNVCEQLRKLRTVWLEDEGSQTSQEIRDFARAFKVYPAKETVSEKSLLIAAEGVGITERDVEEILERIGAVYT